ncbi:hypothetical protein AM499_04795 [Bacillus sp. FJAT-22090]|uniref:hypothetical protein n=1 Tax=Bacillus sp. FJAT-22090 TaxID=1581038 RepID=UPI0006AF109F|nr:hypothetical protein [Bacillus sp. FJAT-22090]ALC85210.1 hypothetical protein AM499_04795 [Bacillus sp. FJAT-22090]
MKNPFLISLYMFIFSCSLSMLLGNPVYSQTTPSDKIEYLYPANKEKIFDETVDEFYQALRDIKYPVHQELYQRYMLKPRQQQRHLDTVLFKEMPNASVNIRGKLLFNKVEGLNYITSDGNILRPYPDIDINYHQLLALIGKFISFIPLKTQKKNLEVDMQFMMLKQKKC